MELAREGARYSLQHLNRFHEEKRQALLVAFLIRTAQAAYKAKTDLGKALGSLPEAQLRTITSILQPSPGRSEHRGGVDGTHL